MKTLAEIERKLKLRKEKLNQTLSEITQQLKIMGALKIILFGSLLSDNVRLSSDLDILVVMPDSKSSKEWLDQIYTQIERKVATDIFIFTQKEYTENKDKSFFLQEVLQRGKIIYEKKI